MFKNKVIDQQFQISRVFLEDLWVFSASPSQEWARSEWRQPYYSMFLATSP